MANKRGRPQIQASREEATDAVLYFRGEITAKELVMRDRIKDLGRAQGWAMVRVCAALRQGWLGFVS